MIDSADPSYRTSSGSNATSEFANPGAQTARFYGPIALINLTLFRAAIPDSTLLFPCGGAIRSCAAWHQRFELPADVRDFQPGFPPKNDLATSFRVTDKQLLVDYFDATYALVTEYLAGLTPADLDTESDHDRYPTPPTIGIRLVSVGTSLAHSVGTIRYRNWMAGRSI